MTIRVPVCSGLALGVVLSAALGRSAEPDKAAETRDATKKAIEAVNRGDFWSAIDDLDRAIEGNPGNPEVFLAWSKAHRHAQVVSAAGQSGGWLGRHVDRDGGWTFAHQRDQLAPFANAGTDRSRVRATALAVLAFLGSGQVGPKARYGDLVEKGLWFIGSEMRLQAGRADLRGERGDMVSHAMATLAFCSYYGMTNDRRFRAPSQAAVRFIEHAQDEAGGWGLEPGKPGDTVVTGWQVMALQSARLAGLDVSDPTIRRTSAFLDSVQSDGGAFYGRTKPGKAPAATAAALLSRVFLGWETSSPALLRGTDYLIQAQPRKDAECRFFATQVARHCSGKTWVDWNTWLRKTVTEAQVKQGPEDGSWFDPNDVQAATGGRLYQTAMNAFSLQIYYRFLPVYGTEVDKKQRLTVREAEADGER